MVHEDKQLVHANGKHPTSISQYPPLNLAGEQKLWQLWRSMHIDRNLTDQIIFGILNKHHTIVPSPDD